MRFPTKFLSYTAFYLSLFLIYLLYDPSYFNIADYQPQTLNPSYDFIVVGSGSAGCAVAGRLAEANYSVLLLEAGGSDKILYPFDPVKMSMAYVFLNQTPHMFDYWAQYDFFNHTLSKSTPRGKLFGGTGAINGQMWSRGHRAIYDLWAAQGNLGWDSLSLDKYFKKAEETMNVSPEPSFVHKSSRDILNAARSIHGSAQDIYEDDRGFGFVSSSAKQGFRQTTCDAYIKPLYHTNRAQNLHVKLFSLVSKLLIDPQTFRVYGVEFVSIDDVKLENPTKKRVIANKEVILSAGTYDSPTILQRSGVGNATELKNIGIPVIHDLPGVGLNLQDHFAIPLVFKTKRSDWTSVYMSGNLENFYNAWKYGKGPLTTQGMEVQGFFRSRFSKYKNASDYHYLCGPVYGKGSRKVDLPEWYEKYGIFSCLVILGTQKNSGYVKIKSKNLSEHAKIHGIFMKDREDVLAAFEAFKHLKKVLDPLEKDGHLESLEIGGLDLKSFEEYSRLNFYTIFHPVGTCKMGDRSRDNLAVVDKELNVYGLKGLRIVDGSIMPEISNANTMGPIIMIAEKAADLIIQKYGVKEAKEEDIKY